jgi:hypothetical protein
MTGIRNLPVERIQTFIVCFIYQRIAVRLLHGCCPRTRKIRTEPVKEWLNAFRVSASLSIDIHRYEHRCLF